jgi:hypothetical protein
MVIPADSKLPFYDAISYTSSIKKTESQNIKINYWDRPTAIFPRYSTLSNSGTYSELWDEGNWVENFKLYICSRSLDEVNSDEATYTCHKKTTWSFVINENSFNIDAQPKNNYVSKPIGENVNGQVVLPASLKFDNVKDGSNPTTIVAPRGNDKLIMLNY